MKPSVTSRAPGLLPHVKRQQRNSVIPAKYNCLLPICLRAWSVHTQGFWDILHTRNVYMMCRCPCECVLLHGDTQVVVTGTVNRISLCVSLHDNKAKIWRTCQTKIIIINLMQLGFYFFFLVPAFGWLSVLITFYLLKQGWAWFWFPHWRNKQRASNCAVYYNIYSI